MKELLVGYDTAIGTPAYQEAEGYDIMNAYTSVAGGGVAKEFRVFARTSYAGNAKIYANKADLSLAASVTAAMYQAGWNTFAISDAAIAGSAQFYLGAVCSPQVLLGYDGGTALEYYRAMAYGDFTPGTINLSNYDTYSPYHYGVAVWGYKPPTITNAEDEALSYDETDFHITVTNGEATQGTGKIWASNSATWGAGTRVEQDVDTWADDGDIIINCVPGTLASGTIYLWIETASGQHNATGYAVTFTAQEVQGVTCTVDIDLPVSVTVPSLVGIKHSAIEIQIPISVEVSDSVSELPLVEYTVDEFISGAGDGVVIDNAAYPENLEVVYGGAYPAYVNDANGTGLNFGTARTYGMGAFNGPLDIGHKVFDALNGSKTVTFETVVKLPSAALGEYDIGNLFVVMQDNGYGCECGLWFWEEAGSQNFEISFIDQDCTGANFWDHYYIRHTSMAAYWGQRVVLHGVIDTANATEEDRIRVYINGTRVTLSRTGGHAGIDVPQNVEIKITRPTEAPGLDGSTTNAPVYICAGGTPEYHAGSGTMRGEFRQGAIYPRIVSDSEIATRAAILSANDDLAWGTAIITQAQSGDHNAASTWVGGIVPGIGDRVVMGSGMTLNIVDNWTIGDDPIDQTLVFSGVGACTINVSAGVTVTIRGGFKAGDAGCNLNRGAGSVFDFQCTSPQLFALGAVDGTLAHGTITINGTASNWCITKSTGATPIRFSTSASEYGSTWQVNWRGSYHKLQNIAYSYCGRSANVDHWIWDADCGPVSSEYAINEAQDCAFEYCSFLQPDLTDDTFSWFPQTATTGERVFDHNVVVGRFGVYSALPDTITGNYFRYHNVTSTAKINAVETFVDILESPAADDIFYLPADYTDLYACAESTNSTSEHFIGVMSTGDDVTISRAAYEQLTDYTGDDGDFALAPYPSTAMTLSLDHVIEIPGPSGKTSGTIATLFGNANVTVTITNCTYLCWLAVGETSAPHAGMVPLFANNLSYGNELIRFQAQAAGIDDIITVADYNNCGGSDPYDENDNAARYATTPGVHDTNTAPAFRDATRNLAKFAVDVLGSTSETRDGQIADARAAFQAANDPTDPDYHASATVIDLLEYLEYGFTPTIELSGAGTNISGYILPEYIGAVEPVVESAIQADGFISVSTWISPVLVAATADGFTSASEWNSPAIVSGSVDSFLSNSVWESIAIPIVASGFNSVSDFGSPYLAEKASGFDSSSEWSSFDIQYEATGFESSAEWKDAHVSQVLNTFDSDSAWSDASLAQVVDGVNSSSTWGDISNAIVLDGFNSSSVWGDVRVAIKANGFESDSVWENAEIAYSGVAAFESSSEWGDGYLSIKADGFESLSQWNDIYLQQVLDGFNSISEWGDALIPDAPLNASGFTSRSVWGDTVIPVNVNGFDSDSVWNNVVMPEMYSSFESVSEWNDFAVGTVLSGFESISEWSDFSSQISVSGFESVSLWSDVELVGAPEEMDGFTSNSAWNDTVYAISIDGFESGSLWVDAVIPEQLDGFDSDSEWIDTSVIITADGFSSDSNWSDIDLPIIVSGLESDSVWADLPVAIEIDGILSSSQWNDLREVEIVSTFDSSSEFDDFIVLYFVDPFDSVSVWGNVTPSRPIPRMGYNIIDIGVNVDTYTSIVAYVGRL